jgi:hypothetical protein
MDCQMAKEPLLRKSGEKLGTQHIRESANLRVTTSFKIP